MTYGRVFSFACEAVRKLNSEGTNVSVLKLNKIKPLPESAVQKISGCRNCFFFEEGIESGGIGQSFGLMLYENGFEGKFRLNAIKDYVHQAKVNSALHRLGLDADGIYDIVTDSLKK